MKKSFIKASLLITLLSVGVMTGCGPKECEHEGGTATCTELAVCTKCGESYGELAEHNYGTVFSHNDEQHWKECACGEKTEVANHEFVPGVIIEEATCTKEGTQLYTCVCGESKTEILPIKTHTYSTTYSYDENEHWFECECKDKKDVAPHNFVEGEITKEATCSEPGIQLYNCICGATKEVELATVVDFNTIVVTSTNSAGDGSYKNTYTTASGWVTKNAAIQAGGASIINPIFPVVGPDGTHKAVCLSGNVNATGTLTSPTLTGGLEQIDVDFTKMFTDTQLSVTITVTEIATGNVYTHTISRELPKNEKYQVYNDSWVLETPVEGDYTIVFTNDCPTGATKDKDRITLLKVEYK